LKWEKLIREVCERNGNVRKMEKVGGKAGLKSWNGGNVSEKCAREMGTWESKKMEKVEGKVGLKS
jgi:hypothetical protein